MKISVVTVVLNAKDVIGKALTSIAEQDYPDIEQVIVDGGSTDGTLDIVARLKREHAIVVSGPDSGIYDAMNKGISLTTGDAIIFLNADDSLMGASVISELVHVLNENPDAELVMGDVLVRGGNRDIYKSHGHITPSKIGYEIVCHQAVLARTSLFNRIGQFDTGYRVCGDLDWLARCAVAGARFAHLPRIVCWYATGGESDRLIQLGNLERAEILSKYRSPMQRLIQRTASAFRRRVRVGGL